MNQRKYQNLIVGTVVLVALFILVFGMAFLNEFMPGKKQDGYVLVTNEVGLLATDDPVKYNGVKMGKVKTIELGEDGVVRIHIAVDGSVRIPKGSRVQIQNVGLMGERMINVALKPGEPQKYNPGDTIPAGYDYGIAETMAIAGELLEEAQVMLNQVKGVMDSTVSRPGFAGEVNGMLARADAVTKRLDKLIVDIEPQVRSMVVDLGATSTTARGMVDRTAPKVDKLMGKADDAAADAQALLTDLRKISGDIKEITEKARSGNSTLGKLANDTAFYKELNGTMRNADSLLLRMRKRGLDVKVKLW